MSSPSPSSSPSVPSKFRSVTDVISRLQYDPSLLSTPSLLPHFSIGYLDRKSNTIEEIPFNIYFSHGDFSSTIPVHRIKYIKFFDLLIWDREMRIDRIFGTTKRDYLRDKIKENKKKLREQMALEEKEKQKEKRKYGGGENKENENDNDNEDDGDDSPSSSSSSLRSKSAAAHAVGYTNDVSRESVITLEHPHINSLESLLSNEEMLRQERQRRLDGRKEEIDIKTLKKEEKIHKITTKVTKMRQNMMRGDDITKGVYEDDDDNYDEEDDDNDYYDEEDDNDFYGNNDKKDKKEMLRKLSDEDEEKVEEFFEGKILPQFRLVVTTSPPSIPPTPEAKRGDLSSSSSSPSSPTTSHSPSTLPSPSYSSSSCSHKKKSSHSSSSSSSSVRPNYFISLRITNPHVLFSLQSTHDLLRTHCRDSLVPLATSHLTICLMALGNQKEVEKAKKIFKDCKEEIQNIMQSNASSSLTFSGLSSFGDKVLFADLSEGVPLLRRINFYMEMKFAKEGLVVVPAGKEKEGQKITGDEMKDAPPTPLASFPENLTFTPHLTIAKISRGSKGKSPNKIVPSWWKSHQDKSYGQQIIDGFQLCSMMEKKGEDGFYNIKEEIHFDDGKEKVVDKKSGNPQ